MKKQYVILIISLVILVIILYKQFMEDLIFPVKGRISSKYGNRIHPVTGAKSFHNGIDIAAPTGTAIISPADGTVESVWFDSLNGNAIKIKHSNHTTGYAHLSKTNVTAGQKVKQGDKIGEVGSTGGSTGPHLHLTVRNSSGQIVDPLSVLV